MEILASPAALVGVASCIAVAGWGMGCWHGIAVRRPEPSIQANQPPAPGSAPTAAECLAQSGALFSPTGNDNAASADCGLALSAMHDEITALRRRERVLANLAPDALILANSSAPSLRESGDVERRPGAYAANTVPPRETPYPSPGASTLTRV